MLTYSLKKKQGLCYKITFCFSTRPKCGCFSLLQESKSRVEAKKKLRVSGFSSMPCGRWLGPLTCIDISTAMITRDCDLPSTTRQQSTMVPASPKILKPLTKDQQRKLGHDFLYCTEELSRIHDHTVRYSRHRCQFATASTL